jgi:hypothetical protein
MKANRALVELALAEDPSSIESSLLAGTSIGGPSCEQVVFRSEIVHENDCGVPPTVT